MSSYVENLQTLSRDQNLLLGEISHWSSLRMMWPDPVYECVPGWKDEASVDPRAPADRLLIYLKFWSICRRSSGARWNLGILLARIAACCWFRVWLLPPIWHHYFVSESLLAPHLAHQLVEIWATTAMKFNHSKESLIILSVFLRLDWETSGTSKCEVKQLLDKGLLQASRGQWEFAAKYTSEIYI